MDDDIPVIVRMRVECARRGHAGDDTHEFDMPIAQAQPMEEYELGKFPTAALGAIHVKRPSAG